MVLPATEILLPALREQYCHYSLNISHLCPDTLKARPTCLDRLFDYFGPPQTAAELFARLEPGTGAGALQSSTGTPRSPGPDRAADRFVTFRVGSASKKSAVDAALCRRTPYAPLSRLLFSKLCTHTFRERAPNKRLTKSRKYVGCHIGH